MKVLVKLTLLVGLSAFFMTGCSRSYMAEREFYKAEKIHNSVKQSDLEAQGPSAYDPAIEAYDKVTEKYPGTPKALESLFEVANLYTKQKEYAKARDSLKKVVINFSSQPERAAEARFRIAKLFEAEDEWGQAERNYWETSEYHPLEMRGLQAPIQVLLHYRGMKYTDASERIFRQILEHYENLAAELGPIEGSMRVRNYIAIANSVMGNWKEARDEWINMANDFSESESGGLALVAAAEASQKLNQQDVALSLYERYVENFPKTNLTGQMLVRIGLIYHKKKVFTEARANYEKALAVFGEDKSQVSDVNLLIGRTYQSEGQWDQASAVYSELESLYPMSPAALQVPLLRATYFESQGESEKAKEIRQEAIQYYEEISLRYPDSRLEKLAQRLIHDAQYQGADWASTLENLDEVITKTESPEKKGELLLMKAIIADKQMNDKDLALTLYDDFLRDYSDHTLAQTAKNHRELLAAKS